MPDGYYEMNFIALWILFFEFYTTPNYFMSAEQADILFIMKREMCTRKKDKQRLWN